MQLVVSGATVAMLPGAVTVEAAAPTDLVAHLVMPSAVRVGRPFAAYVTYCNEGNTDMAAPMLILTSGGQGEMCLQATGSFSTADLDLLGVSYEGPAGILRAGQQWQIPVFAEDPSTTAVTYSLSSLTGDNATPIDWSLLGPQIRPAGMTDQQWAAMLSILMTNLGPNWGNFVTALATDATRLAQHGELTTDEGTILEMEIRKSEGLGVSTISGVLVNENGGAPVANTQITATASDLPPVATRTDANGRFAFTDLLPDTYQLSAVNCNFDTAPTYTVTSDTDVLNVLLQATITSLSGSLVSTNTSVGGMSINAFNTVTGETFSAVSNADGTYTFPAVTAGSYTFTVAGAVVTQTSPSPVQIVTGQSLADVTLTVVTEGTLAGTVTRAQPELPSPALGSCS